MLPFYRHVAPLELRTVCYCVGSCKKKVQSKSGARCPAYGGLVCTISVALNLNMSVGFLILKIL